MPRRKKNTSDSDDYMDLYSETESESETETEWDSDYDSPDSNKQVVDHVEGLESGFGALNIHEESVLTITTALASLNAHNHLLTIQIDLTLSDATLITTSISFPVLQGDDNVSTGLRFGIECVNKYIAPALIGKTPTEQLLVDKLITQQLEEQCLREHVSSSMKKVAAGNVIFAVSVAICKAGAHVKKMPLYKHIKEIVDNNKKHKRMKKSKFPAPVLKVLNTGQLDLPKKLFKEQFTLVPLSMPSFKQSIAVLRELYGVSLKNDIIKQYGEDAINEDPDGGYTLNISVRDASKLLHYICFLSDYTEYVHFGVDFSASESDKPVNEDLVEICSSLVFSFSLVIIKDTFGVNDWDNYRKLVQQVNFVVRYFEKQGVPFEEKPLVVTKDHSLLTDSKKLKKAVKKKISHALFIEVSQLRSITECIKALKLAKRAGWKLFMSGHNSLLRLIWSG